MFFRVVSRMSCGLPIVASMMDRTSFDASLARKIELVNRQVYQIRFVNCGRRLLPHTKGLAFIGTDNETP